MSQTDEHSDKQTDERPAERTDKRADERTDEQTDKRTDKLTLDRVVSYLVRSIVARLVVAGIAIVAFQFIPWSTVLRYTGQFQQQTHVNQQFEQVAEALRTGRGTSQGYDPALGPIDIPSSPSYERPKVSEDGIVSSLLRKIGFGDGPVRAPEWVPIFPGCIDKGTIVQSTPDGEKQIIRAAVAATGPSIASFYERAFTRMGFTFTNEETGSGNTLAAESPDGTRSVTVAISARGARSTLAITHLERLNGAAVPEAETPAE